MQTWELADDEIRLRTRESSNERIDREMHDVLHAIGNSPERIRARLDELSREWDIDRALMLNFAIAGGLSASLAMRNVYRTGKLGGWGALFFTQIGFLAHHAIRRWCPPMPVFRRLGFRSTREINAERLVLQKRLEELER